MTRTQSCFLSHFVYCSVCSTLVENTNRHSWKVVIPSVTRSLRFFAAWQRCRFVAPFNVRRSEAENASGRIAMRRLSICRLLLALALVAALFVGCSRDPNVRKQKYFESGQRYFDKGQYREAIIQFKNAVQIDSTYGNAHYRLAQTFLKLEQWSSAYQELGRTIELQPDNYPARVDMANLLIAGRDFKQAQEQTD